MNDLLDHDRFYEFDAQVRGKVFHILSRPSVFSWNQLDEGTRVLLETVDIGEAETILDLGCGYGIIGAVAAHFAPVSAVYMTDAELDAIESARRTISANGAVNCNAVLGNSVSAVKDIPFDLVLTNLPFHLGKETSYDTAIQFIRDASAVLNPGGRFYLVANRFIPYEDQLQKSFGNVGTIYQDSHFKILTAVQNNRAIKP